MATRKFIFNSMLVFLALCLLLSFCSGKDAIREDSLCLLCSNGVEGLQRPEFNVDSRGKTCVKLALETALRESPNSNDCNDVIDNFRAMCCGDEEPDTIAQAPTAAPAGYTGPMGDYPACPICHDATYPANPAMVINMLGLGADSCRNYYDYGRRGLIRTDLCATLQFFAYDPCGCGILDSDPGGDYGGSSSDADSDSLFQCFKQWLRAIFGG